MRFKLNPDSDYLQNDHAPIEVIMNIVTIFNGKRSWASDPVSETRFRMFSAFAVCRYSAECTQSPTLQNAHAAEWWLWARRFSQGSVKMS